MAAVLAGGGGAALSHGSAAALWGIGEERGWIEVSVRRRCELRRPGIRFHGRPSLEPGDIVLHDDIPATSPAQTLVDLATQLDPVPLERAVNDADKRDLIDPEALRAELIRFRGNPGVRLLRHLLDKLFFRLSDSGLEIYFRRIVRAGKLPVPLTKQRVPLRTQPRPRGAGQDDRDAPEAHPSLTTARRGGNPIRPSDMEPTA